MALLDGLEQARYGRRAIPTVDEFVARLAGGERHSGELEEALGHFVGRAERLTDAANTKLAGGEDLTADEQQRLRTAAQDAERIFDACSRAGWFDKTPATPYPVFGPASPSGQRVSGLRASYDQPLNWGREFVDARRAIGAQLLDPGTAPVSVPLARAPITDARQAAFVFELMPTQDAPGGHFAYMRQVLRELNAAIVPRGGLKPISRFKLERRDDTTKVVAHITDPIDRFDLADATALERWLNDELQYGLNKALDAHVMALLLTDATAGGAVSLAAIRAAITALQERDLQPSGIVLAPTDWQTVEAEAVALNSVNSPAVTDAMQQRLYSVPVVVSNSIAAGTGLVGDFRGSAEIYRTGQAQLSLHDSHPRAVDTETVPDFRLNQVVARAEMRAEIAITRPAGFVRLATV